MKQFLIETSARHAHITKEAVKILFGDDGFLDNRKDLSQPGQFATSKKITVVGPKGSMNLTILGPERSANQVEISLTDARSLGLNAPIRESGDIANSGACKIVGPCGEIELSEGVIAAKRHIHMTPADAEELNVTNGEIVNVKVLNDAGRAIIFGDVVVRVSPSYALAMHVDTDEANAGALSGVVYGEIVK